MTPHPHDASEPCPGGCEDIKTVEAMTCKARADIATMEGRMQDIHDQMTRFETRLDESNARMSDVEKSLSANSNTLTLNTAETTEILQILRDSKAFFRVAGYAGSAIKWALGILTAGFAFWLTIKDMGKH